MHQSAECFSTSLRPSVSAVEMHGTNVRRAPVMEQRAAIIGHTNPPTILPAVKSMNALPAQFCERPASSPTFDPWNCISPSRTENRQSTVAWGSRLSCILIHMACCVSRGHGFVRLAQASLMGRQGTREQDLFHRAGRKVPNPRHANGL